MHMIYTYILSYIHTHTYIYCYYCLTLLCIVLSVVLRRSLHGLSEARSFGAACGDHHRSDRGLGKVCVSPWNWTRLDSTDLFDIKEGWNDVKRTEHEDMWSYVKMNRMHQMVRWILISLHQSATEPRPDWRMQPSAALRHWQLLLRRKSLLQVGRDGNLRRSMFKRSRSGESTLSILSILSISSISSCDFGDLALKLLWLLCTSFACIGGNCWATRIWPTIQLEGSTIAFLALWNCGGCSTPCHCAKKSPE